MEMDHRRVRVEGKRVGGSWQGWDYSGEGEGGENRTELGCVLEIELIGFLRDQMLV